MWNKNHVLNFFDGFAIMKKMLALIFIEEKYKQRQIIVFIVNKMKLKKIEYELFAKFWIKDLKGQKIKHNIFNKWFKVTFLLYYNSLKSQYWREWFRIKLVF